ncbi:MAG: 50S ribosomal protein L27 [Patescibacteria group bacterium]|nr:MAG: 50S ribosomal protein L27 [Patescibacteria group bacterium]
MAHKKAGGSKARQKSRVAGKRLGLKVGAGQHVPAGGIIIRQRGMKIAPGGGVGVGRDFTIFAKREGRVVFSQKQGKKIVSVE